MLFVKIAATSAVISLLGIISPLTARSSTSGEEGTTDEQSMPNPGREVISAHVLAKAEAPHTEAPASDESIARMLGVEATAPGPGLTLAAARVASRPRPRAPARARDAVTRVDRKPNLKSFKHVYLLGDSLTDQTNAFNKMRGLWCPNPAKGYWHGRFTNGRNWVDYFQENNHLKGLENMAVGGSKVLTSALWRPSLMKQAQAAVAKTPKGDRGKTLVILWSGPNDLTEAAQAQKNQGGTKSATSNGWKFGYKVGMGVVQVMNYLRKEGIGRLVVADLPPLDIVPVVRTAPYTNPKRGIGRDRVAFLKSAVRGANFVIASHAVVNKEVHVPMSKLMAAYITGEIKNPVMDDVHNACQVLGGMNACTVTFRHNYIDKQCPKQLFMDQLHPTSLGHCFIKVFFEEAMVQAGYSGITFGDCGPRT